MAILNIPTDRLILAKMKIEAGESSLLAAAKQLGISWSGLKSAFDRAGIEISKPPEVFSRVRKGVSKEALLEAKALIEAGEATFKSQAAAMGMTENPLRRRFQRAGLIVRSPKNRGRPIGQKIDVQPAYCGPWDVALSNRMLQRSFLSIGQA